MLLWTILNLAVANGPIVTDRDVQRESCDQGEAKECTSLGLRYRDGRGAPQDAHFALELFQKGCQLGDATACVYRADSYRTGNGVTRDTERAVELYTKGCIEQSLGRACRALGEIYILGDGVGLDSATSSLWYEQGCELNDGDSCVAAALGFERGDQGGVDPMRGRAMLAQACQLHNGRGCTLLGRRYLNGYDGAEKDIDNASAMYAAGCALKDAEACREVGSMAMRGKGMPKDLESAEIYLYDSCAAGDYEGCKLLAKLLVKIKEYPKAVQALKHGCELGDQSSCKRIPRYEYKASLYAE